MNASILALVLSASLFACGNSSDDVVDLSDSSTDATTGDAATDSAATDGAATDAAGGDAATEGGLSGGDSCDPQNDQCGSGLKCCVGGASLDDAGAGHCFAKTDAGTCPLVP